MEMRMAAYEDIAFKDLETKGFAHVPGFLSPAEVDQCCDDFRNQPLSDNRNYGISAVSEKAVDRLRDRIEATMRIVSTTTALKVDRVVGGAYFATARGISFPWHQDHESFYSSQ